VNDLSTYWIEIIGLANKSHSFEYSINDLFFNNFEESEIKQGSLKCWLQLNKNDNFIEIRFEISGKVRLICDRSLDLFDHLVEIEKHMLFKYGEEDKEIDDEIEMISRNRQGINVGQYIYEFIATAIPMKKLHPRYVDDEEANGTDEIIYTSNSEDGEDRSKQEDPRWEILKKLRNNIN